MVIVDDVTTGFVTGVCFRKLRKNPKRDDSPLPVNPVRPEYDSSETYLCLGSGSIAFAPSTP